MYIYIKYTEIIYGERQTSFIQNPQIMFTTSSWRRYIWSKIIFKNTLSFLQNMWRPLFPFSFTYFICDLWNISITNNARCQCRIKKMAYQCSTFTNTKTVNPMIFLSGEVMWISTKLMWNRNSSPCAQFEFL